MAWIHEDTTRRQIKRFGNFLPHEWREFGEIFGIRFRVTDLPSWLPAFRVEKTIFLRRGLTPKETNWWAWHEIAHVLWHPGNLLAPLGLPDQTKHERQAEDFSLSFPTWDAGGVVSDAIPTRCVSWDFESARCYLGCLWGGGV